MDTLPIVRVTVHPDGAVITRAGTLPAPEGQVLVRGLPLLLEPSSVRARAPGLRQARLHLDTQGADRGEESDLRVALRQAQEEVDRLEAERAVLREERTHLELLRPPLPETEERRKPPSPERLGLWLRLEQELTGPRAQELDAQLRTLERQLDEARRSRDQARLRHQWASTEKAWRHWAPTRHLSLSLSQAAEAVQVELSYRVPGATWSPGYALHTDRELTQGRLMIRALVAQATGEDWRGVQLTLSSTPSARPITLPELPSLRLGTAQPPQPSPWRDLPEDLDELFPGELPAPGALAAVAQAEEEEVEEEERIGFGAGVPLPQSMPAPAPPLAAAPSGGMAPPSPKRDRARALKKKARRRAAVARTPVASSADMDDLSAALEPEPMLMDAPQEPGEVQVGDELMDYASLRLSGWQEQGRGRLHRVDLAQEVREAGLPQGAADWLSKVVGKLERKIRAVRHLDLPPRHQRPEPVEGLDYRISAQGTVDVPSTGRPTTLALQAEPLELRVRYRAVPRRDPRVFRTAVARLGRSSPLPPGPVDVYLDGALTLSTSWRGSPGGGQIELGMGPEQGLQLARNVRYEEETAGLLGGSRRLHTRVSVEVASSLGREVEVELLDRVPVSRDEDVKVAEVDAHPKARPWEGDPEGPRLEGGRSQRLRVPAGASVEATLHYTVTLGGRQELVGGDRRG